MATSSAIIEGKIRYAKILGEPVDNYDKDGMEWTFEIEATDATKAILKAKRCKNRFKSIDGVDYTKFQRDSVKKDGSAAKPFIVYDAYGDPWDQEKLIGNGSLVAVKVLFSEREHEGKRFNKASAYEIVVVEHVPYTKDSGFNFKDKGEDTNVSSTTDEWTE